VIANLEDGGNKPRIGHAAG